MRMNSKSIPEITPSRHEVWKMFDRVARRYDFLNHFLSLNRDVTWRRKVAELLPGRKDQTVLDLATGTADQLLSLYGSDRVESGVGLDLSEEMLIIGRRKIAARQLEGCLTLRNGDAGAIPFDDNTFDAVTISFGIRNVTDVCHTLREMHRVLKPGGRALILEFSLPENRILRSTYLFYLRHVLPGLGGIISGDGRAYRYLDRTVESFPCGEAFCRLMRDAGFANAQARPLTFGVATIYHGDTA